MGFFTQKSKFSKFLSYIFFLKMRFKIIPRTDFLCSIICRVKLFSALIPVGTKCRVNLQFFIALVLPANIRLSSKGLQET
jgi:hypothetical protein